MIPVRSQQSRHFNPRAPCGARRNTHPASAMPPRFQSTRPVWGATCAPYHNRGGFSNFNPRAPCGARLMATGISERLTLISIHAPRVGRDPPLPPRGGGERISIHAPRVGRDQGPKGDTGAQGAFQSTRPVWGATIKVANHRIDDLEFQSTRPVWGATRGAAPRGAPARDFNPRAPCGARLQPARMALWRHGISIHAPRVGRDIFRTP